MFNKKIKEQLKELQEFKENIIACDKCGKLIFKENAIKQKSEVRDSPRYIPFGLRENIFEMFRTEEYIHNDYFCKKCDSEKIKNNKSNK